MLTGLFTCQPSEIEESRHLVWRQILRRATDPSNWVFGAYTNSKDPDQVAKPQNLTLASSDVFYNIGIKHGFLCINIRQVPWEVLKFEARGQGTWRMLMHWKTMFDRYYWVNIENICYLSRYFLHYFDSPFRRCLANAISTDYARSRAGHYTCCNASKSVAPVRSYWKFRSRALTACELPCWYTAFRRLMHGC